MKATFYFKDGTILKVRGNYGIYNNKNNDMSFRENVSAEYQQNYLFSDNLDFFNTKNSLTIYGNVSLTLMVLSYLTIPFFRKPKYLLALPLIAMLFAFIAWSLTGSRGSLLGLLFLLLISGKVLFLTT